MRYGKVYHLVDPKERKAFHDEGGHSRTGCPEVCGVAARIGAEVLLDIREKSRKKRLAKTPGSKGKLKVKARR
jgi:hypothetical protein